MKYSLIAVAVAGLATAQYSGVPSCATTCINSLLPASCNLDFTCICTYPGFIDNISCCVSKSCDTADQQQALAAAQQICSGANVQLPSAAGCTGAAASASSSAASSGVSASVHSSAASVASSAATVTGTAASSASSKAASASSAASSKASSASSAISSAISSAQSSASSHAAGNKFKAPGVIGAALMGLAAFL